MGLFRRKGLSGRQRREYRDHLAELDILLEDGLERLGAEIAKMTAAGAIDGPHVWEQAARLSGIEDEINLVERGISEGLNREQLMELARQDTGDGDA